MNGLNARGSTLLPGRNLGQTARQSWLVAGPCHFSVPVPAALASPGKTQARMLQPVTCCTLRVQNDNTHLVVKINLTARKKEGKKVPVSKEEVT